MTKFEEPEIPAEFLLKYSVKTGNEKFKEERVVWRIMILDSSDGSIDFLGNNSSLDWKSEYQARRKADDWNNYEREWLGSAYCHEQHKNKVAIVRKCKVTTEEI